MWYRIQSIKDPFKLNFCCSGLSRSVCWQESCNNKMFCLHRSSFFPSLPSSCHLTHPQRRSRRSPPVVRWRSNRKCLQTPKIRGSFTLGPSSTAPLVCTTCHSWRRLWHMVLTYTPQVKRRRGKRHSFRPWSGWEFIQPAKLLAISERAVNQLYWTFYLILLPLIIL